MVWLERLDKFEVFLVGHVAQTATAGYCVLQAVAFIFGSDTELLIEGKDVTSLFSPLVGVQVTAHETPFYYQRKVQLEIFQAELDSLSKVVLEKSYAAIAICSHSLVPSVKVFQPASSSSEARS